MNIRYLKNSEINTRAWDKCIKGAINGTLHACSWYLDLTCDRWDALVEDEYKSVMPLTIKQKWGHEIIDLPVFSNELGIFSGEPITATKTREFVDNIPFRFGYYRILLNKYNPLDAGYIPYVIRNKYELDLIKPYHRLAEDFNPALRSKLNLAMARGYKMAKDVTPEDLIGFIKVNGIDLDKPVAKNNFRFLHNYMDGLIRYKSGEIYGIFDRHNQLASVALFSWFNSRLYLQFIVTAPALAEDYPHLFLLDRFVEKYAETNSTLSFGYLLNGSDPGDYTCFAARENHLAEITRNTRPFYLKWLNL